MVLTESELLEMIAEGEGRSLEFKRGLPRDEKLARTLCAFANTRGGWLLVGVNDNRTLHFCPRPGDVEESIRRVAREFLEPPLDVETSAVSCVTGTVVAARINASPQRPHRVVNGPREEEIVVRVGSSNRVAGGATLNALRAQRSGSRARSPLEASILAWVAERTRLAEDPGGDATPAAYGRAFNIGVQRARRAFVRLERDGLLVAYGSRNRKFYALP